MLTWRQPTSLNPNMDFAQSARRPVFNPEAQFLRVTKPPAAAAGTPIWQTLKHLKATNCSNSPCYGYAMLRFESVL